MFKFILILSIFISQALHAEVKGFKAIAKDGYITPVSVKNGTEKGALTRAKKALRNHCYNVLDGEIVNGYKVLDSFCEDKCTILACATICQAIVTIECEYYNEGIEIIE